MKPLAVQDFRTLLADHPEPCISIYMPTHRRHPDTEQNPVTYKRLLGEAARRLGERLSPKQVAALLDPMQALGDRGYWSQPIDSLAAFRSPDLHIVVTLPIKVDELVVVADTFHTKWLVRVLQRSQRFHILALAQNEVILFQATPHSIAEVDLRGVPHSLREALGVEEWGSSLSSHAGSGGGGRAVLHGHGIGRDKKKDELLRYFRVIDRALWDYLREEKTPLVLAGVGYYRPIYREVSRYPYLVAKGVEGSAEKMNPQELHEKAWPLVEAVVRAEEEKLCDQFRNLRSSGRSTDLIDEVGRAVVAGRVGTLFLAEGQRIYGVLDRRSGEVDVRQGAREPLGGDILDDLGEQTILRGGDVLVLQPERMPSASPVAAILRY
ncbi:MAG: hypothetical protein AB1486_03860 [Planctomycetota bacterium]